jgi:Ca2+-binding EF-hand superfamily protein
MVAEAISKLYSGAKKWWASGVVVEQKIRLSGIGVPDWDGTDDGRGELESEVALTQLFARHGVKAIRVSIHHRVTGAQNASWAWVTLRDEKAVQRVLSQASEILLGLPSVEISRCETSSASSPRSPAASPRAKVTFRDANASAREMMESMFLIIDDDDSGDFCIDEFTEGMKRLQIDLSGAEIAAVLHLMDEDGGASIDAGEFCEKMEEIHDESMVAARAALSALCAHLSRTGESAADAFRRLDTDGTGDLDLDEFHAALKELGTDISVRSNDLPPLDSPYSAITCVCRAPHLTFP